MKLLMIQEHYERTGEQLNINSDTDYKYNNGYEKREINWG